MQLMPDLDAAVDDFVAVLHEGRHVFLLVRTVVRIDLRGSADHLVDPLPVPAHADGRDPQAGLAQPAIFHLGL